MNSPVDQSKMEAIQGLYVADDACRAFFDHCATRDRDRTETLAEWVERNFEISYGVIIRMFRRFEELGLGRLIEGRRGSKTRFHWEYSLRSIGKAAKKQTTKLENIETANGYDPEDVDRESDAQAIGHVYKLRPHTDIQVTLPSDLSAREADRIAAWIRTLPFE